MKKLATLGLTLSSIATLTAVSLTASPTQAAQIDGSIGFIGTNTYNPVINTPISSGSLTNLTSLTFNNNFVNFVSGDFSMANPLLLNSVPTVQHLNLTYINTSSPNTYNYNATISNNPFINFGNVTIGTQVNTNLRFVLNNPNFGFTIVKSSNQSLVGTTTNNAPLNGKFIFGNDTIGEGIVTLNKTGVSQNYSFTVATNPTVSQTPEPSAILGLVGVLGLGVLAKKSKKEA